MNCVKGRLSWLINDCHWVMCVCVCMHVCVCGGRGGVLGKRDPIGRERTRILLMG